MTRAKPSIGVVRRLLTDTDYSATGIGRLGVEAGMGVRAPDVPILVRALEPVEPLATLVRLFLLGQPIAAVEVRRRLGPDAVAALVEAGLARVTASLIEPILRLTPWRGLVIAHDPDPTGDLWREHVAGPTPAADVLLQLVAPRKGRALDVGTGTGLLALALASEADSVVATDVNDAALRLARLNADLNEIENVEVRAGSFFEPVAGERYDLIVSNPPFVMAPDADVVFRSVGAVRDDVSRDVVRGVAAHLADGGYGYVLANWVHDPREAWIETVRGWVAGTGCDAVCFLHGLEDPLSYAVRWNAREQQLRPDRYDRTLAAWLGHLERTGVRAIGSGAVVLKRPGAGRVHALEPAGPGEGAAGRQVLRIFEGLDSLRERDVAELLASAVRMVDDHRLEQSLVARGGEYTVEPATLVSDAGLTLPVGVAPDLVPVLLRFDGSQRLAEIVTEVATATEVEADALSERALALVRQLLENGYAELT